jgi:hypothetical protein
VLRAIEQELDKARRSIEARARGWREIQANIENHNDQLEFRRSVLATKADLRGATSSSGRAWSAIELGSEQVTRSSLAVLDSLRQLCEEVSG